MNKTFFIKSHEQKERWRLIDAQGKVVGRLATEISDALRGKDRPTYTPHADGGDYVVVINADKIVFTGKKMDQKIYQRYTGYMGNRKEFTAKQVMEKRPERIIELAVRGMLPKNKLARQLHRKLRVYAGNEHPHEAQIRGFKEA